MGKLRILTLVAACSAGCSAFAGPNSFPRLEPGTVTTFAGSTYGSTDGKLTEARFGSPLGLAFDAAGNLYVADSSTARIRKISATGIVSTLAGSTYGYADGPVSSAKFLQPNNLEVDSHGNILVSDNFGHAVRKISPDGNVSILVGQGRTQEREPNPPADTLWPVGLAISKDDTVYVSDPSKNLIQKVASSGEVTTLTVGTDGYEDGPLASAKFKAIYDLAVDSKGNLLIADAGNNCIRQVTPEGIVSTLAGSGSPTQDMTYRDGPGREARFNYPSFLAVSSQDVIYVSDSNNNRIRKIAPDGTVTTVAGNGTRCQKIQPAAVQTTTVDNCFSDGIGTNTKFDQPAGIAIDSTGAIFVADSGNYRIRRIEP